MDAVVAATTRPSGPEWFTLAQMRERYKLNYTAAYKRLESLILEGRVEVNRHGRAKNLYRWKHAKSKS